MPLDLRAKLGIGLIVAGGLFFVSVTYWAKTRKYVLVDMPVSLARGSIDAAFEINQSALYSILIWTGDASSLSCYENSILQTRRLVSVARGRVGHITPDIAPPGQDVTFGPYLGMFEGMPGKYRLKINVLSDASCLNSGHPRLVIEASPGDYQKRDERCVLAGFTLFITTVLGVVLIVLGRRET